MKHEVVRGDGWERGGGERMRERGVGGKKARTRILVDL